MLIYDCLYMLPHAIVMTCTFEVRMVHLLVEMLFPLVLELDLLIYLEFTFSHRTHVHIPNVMLPNHHTDFLHF